MRLVDRRHSSRNRLTSRSETTESVYRVFSVDAARKMCLILFLSASVFFMPFYNYSDFQERTEYRHEAVLWDFPVIPETTEYATKKIDLTLITVWLE